MQTNAKKKCQFCVDQIKHIDYKNLKVINIFVSPYRRIKPKYYTGVCLNHQRSLAKAIKNARIVALLRYVNR